MAQHQDLCFQGDPRPEKPGQQTSDQLQKSTIRQTIHPIRRLQPTGLVFRQGQVHGKGGDEDRAVDADLVHRCHHLVNRNVIGPIRRTVPWSLRGVRLISVDLTRS